MHFRIQRQITAALENHPGQLAAICQWMAEQRINIEALSVIDSIEQGVVRLVTSDAKQCRQLLKDHGVYVIEANIIAVELTDRVGQLAIISRQLADAGVNIDYLYGSSDQTGAPARIILKVSDVDRAVEILSSLHLE
ncbi:MAG TPA: hypothetical protein VIT21_02075 [Chthoniobacterales bacterium]